jgi:cytochrome c oxidase assembly protein Cox11
VKDFKLTVSSIGMLIAAIWKLDLVNKAYRVTIIGWRERRSNDQNSLYWKWLAEICKQWDVTDDPEILHEIFKKFYCPEKVINEHISVKSTKKLDIGEMHFYLNKIECFCINRGYLITIPDQCEYRELQDKQNE